MLEDKDAIKTILECRVEPSMLFGYLDGIFSPDHNRFFAKTLVDIKEIDYDDFDYLHDQLNGYITYNADEEKTRIYHADGSYSRMSKREEIENGLLRYFSVSFTGIYFQQQWYILESLCFYGDLEPLEKIKADLFRYNSWKDSLFEPYRPREITVGNRKVSVFPVGYKAYADEPYLVAIVKNGEKEKINSAFNNYFNLEFIVPFLKKLRIENPAGYKVIEGKVFNFPMVYPEDKQYVIFCCMAMDDKQKFRLNYFLYIINPGEYFNWNYFPVEDFDDSFYYAELIINDLKTISNWDEPHYLDSSCTMDDEGFWANYVFAKNQSGAYLYLTAI